MSLFDILPNELQRTIYGMSVTCCCCGKQSVLDSSGKASQSNPFFETKTGLKFCSKDCLSKVVEAFRKEDWISDNKREIVNSIVNYDHVIFISKDAETASKLTNLGAVPVVDI